MNGCEVRNIKYKRINVFFHNNGFFPEQLPENAFKQGTPELEKAPGQLQEGQAHGLPKLHCPSGNGWNVRAL